jgi:hypothetical protein
MKHATEDEVKLKRRQAEDEVELKRLREEAQGAIRTAEDALRKLRSERKAKYVLTEFEEAQKKLGEAHNMFELNTRQGYSEAARIAEKLCDTANSLYWTADQQKKKQSEKRWGMFFGTLGYAFLGYVITAIPTGLILACAEVITGDKNLSAGFIIGGIGAFIGAIIGLAKGAEKD